MNFIDQIVRDIYVIRSKADAERMLKRIPHNKKFYFNNGNFIDNETPIIAVWRYRKLLNAELRKMRNHEKMHL